MYALFSFPSMIHLRVASSKILLAKPSGLNFFLPIPETFIGHVAQTEYFYNIFYLLYQMTVLYSSMEIHIGKQKSLSCLTWPSVPARNEMGTKLSGSVACPA